MATRVGEPGKRRSAGCRDAFLPHGRPSPNGQSGRGSPWGLRRHSGMIHPLAGHNSPIRRPECPAGTSDRTQARASVRAREVRLLPVAGRVAGRAVIIEQRHTNPQVSRQGPNTSRVNALETAQPAACGQGRREASEPAQGVTGHWELELPSRVATRSATIWCVTSPEKDLSTPPVAPK